MLYIIATPIGNLKDITLRALEVLEAVEVLLCEDTRKTGLMLQNLGIQNKPQLISFYDEVEQQKIPQVVDLLKKGVDVGLVTDAGTPLLSDPGWLLVNRCRKENIAYTALPGPSAAINALVLSGMPMGRFSYLGFLPKKSGERKKVMEKYKEVEGVKIVYESPFRIRQLLEEVSEVYGSETQVTVLREMTKKFEEKISGKVSEIFHHFERGQKGEFVVIIG